MRQRGDGDGDTPGSRCSHLVADRCADGDGGSRLRGLVGREELRRQHRLDDAVGPLPTQLQALAGTDSGVEVADVDQHPVAGGPAQRPGHGHARRIAAKDLAECE